MSRDGTETRARLLDAAARAFADHGVAKASLLEIARAAGQRNRGAVHYHFGSRDALLAAVLDQHVDFLVRRERELLSAALEVPGRELGPVLEAVVRPIVELATSGWQGRCYLLIIAELVMENRQDLSPEVNATLARTAGRAVFAELRERMPPMPEELCTERLALLAVFMLRATADRARLLDRRLPGRPQVADEPFIANLVEMTAQAAIAPVPSRWRLYREAEMLQPPARRRRARPG